MLFFRKIRKDSGISLITEHNIIKRFGEVSVHKEKGQKNSMKRLWSSGPEATLHWKQTRLCSGNHSVDCLCVPAPKNKPSSEVLAFFRRWVCLRWTDDNRGKVHLFQRWLEVASPRAGLTQSQSIYHVIISSPDAFGPLRKLEYPEGNASFHSCTVRQKCWSLCRLKILNNKYKYYTCSLSSLIWVHSWKAIISTICWRISARGQVRISVKVNHGRSFYFSKTALSTGSKSKGLIGKLPPKSVVILIYWFVSYYLWQQPFFHKLSLNTSIFIHLLWTWMSISSICPSSWLPGRSQGFPRWYLWSLSSRYWLFQAANLWACLQCRLVCHF